ncbi:hypothetical protein DUI87_12678 [Hirundo rustica rustica]|uniref:Uncharacterized protein n=1 Tax=Hirundo rustica rustica TaxID=333673 RepID=A0A3M0KBP1_HIRRU|nr:hypothetical protein DUI87_12678 [Hirundo rustica rustica]
MATGGYRSAGGSTTDFLEEWKAKREKMRAKQAPPAPGAPGGGEPRAAGSGPSAELNNNNNNLPPDRAAPPAGGTLNCVSLASAALGLGAPHKEPPPALVGNRGAEPAAAPGSPEGEEKLAAKGKSSGPSARKGKGQIEKRKLREKRRSTGVVNIPAAELQANQAALVKLQLYFCNFTFEDDADIAVEGLVSGVVGACLGHSDHEAIEFKMDMRADFRLLRELEPEKVPIDWNFTNALVFQKGQKDALDPSGQNVQRTAGYTRCIVGEQLISSHLDGFGFVSMRVIPCSEVITFKCYFRTKSLDEYEDDEAGQKERKKEDAITQQNTIQNESSSADTSCSYLLQVERDALHRDDVKAVIMVFKLTLVGGNLLPCADHDMNQVLHLPSAMVPLAWETQMIPLTCVRKTGTEEFHVFMVTHDQAITQDSSRMVSSRYKSTANAPEDDAPNRYSRTERTTFSRYSRDANSSGSSLPSNTLEKRIEELERELAKERQENARLMKMAQDKEEIIGKLKEEIDLLNRDLDDIEDENEQLKQENKTLLKVVGQLTSKRKELSWPRPSLDRQQLSEAWLGLAQLPREDSRARARPQCYFMADPRSEREADQQQCNKEPYLWGAEELEGDRKKGERSQLDRASQLSVDKGRMICGLYLGNHWYQVVHEICFSSMMTRGGCQPSGGTKLDAVLRSG